MARPKKIAPNSRLTEADILDIRAAYERGESARVVADVYDVAPSTIQKIWRGDTFRGVGQPGDGLAPAKRNPMIDEPLQEEIDASQARLLEMLEREGLAAGILKDLEGEKK